MPPVDDGAADASISARPEGPAVGQRQLLMAAAGTPAQSTPQQQQLADISEDANSGPMQDSMRTLRQAIAAEDAARKEVKEALRLVRELRAIELLKVEQRKAREEAEEAARQSKRSSMGRQTQPLLYGTARPAVPWEPEVPSMEETEDLLQQLEELAQQRWTPDHLAPKVQDVVHEAPARQRPKQTEQDEVLDTARTCSADLLQQLQDCDILIKDNAPVAGAQQRKGEGSMASTRTPYSERGGTRDMRTCVASAAGKGDGKGLAKTRRMVPRKADGKGNGRGLRRKANGGDEKRVAAKGAPAPSASSASASSTARKPLARRVGGPSTPRWESSSQARQASNVVLETVQVSPVPFTCPVFVACQACPESRRAAAANL